MIWAIGSEEFKASLDYKMKEMKFQFLKLLCEQSKGYLINHIILSRKFNVSNMEDFEIPQEQHGAKLKSYPGARNLFAYLALQ